MTPELFKVIVGLAWPVVVLILALRYATPCCRRIIGVVLIFGFGSPSKAIENQRSGRARRC
jgi:hypothetical protein